MPDKRIFNLTQQASYDADLKLIVDKSSLTEARGIAMDFVGPWVKSGNDISYTAGDVAIGTALPNSRLHVSGTTSGFVLLNLENTNDDVAAQSGYVMSLAGTDAVSSTAAFITTRKDQEWTGVASTRDANMTFHTALNNVTTEHMRITSGGNVGIGTTSPTALLHIRGTSGVLILEDTNSGARVNLVNSTATPAADTEIARLQFVAKDDGGTDTVYGRILGFVTDDTDGSEDGYITLQTASAGTVAERVRIDNAGNVGIGATSGPSANGGKVLFFGLNAADPTMGANTAGLYAKDVSSSGEMFAVDEAGNAAQLTPHNFSLFTPDPTFEYPWSYFAENKYIGKRINVDMFLLAREVERLGGKTIIHLEDLPINEQIDWDEVQEGEVERSKDRRAQQLAANEPQEELHVKKQMPNWMQNL